MTAELTNCPTCRSVDRTTTPLRPGAIVPWDTCYNPWHRGLVVHFMRESLGTPGAECHATCGAEIDDPPSQLAVDWEFVSCPRCLAAVPVPACDRSHPAPTCPDPACYREEYARKVDQFFPQLGNLIRQGQVDRLSTSGKISGDDDRWKDPATIIRRHRELSDDEIERAMPNDLRTAYRELRDHHVAETTALISRRDDLTRRRDEQLARDQQILAESQQLLTNADAIMRRDEETIDRLSIENVRLSEIIDFMQNHYSPIGGRACALCVYVDGRFVRPCAVHRWDDTAAKLLASRAAEPVTTDYLSDDELAAWLDRAGLKRAALEGTYLRLVLDELRERRDAEAFFVDVDLQLQGLMNCEACTNDTHGSDDEHRAILKRWRIAQAALCALARIHRGYRISFNVTNGGDPR